MNVSLERVSTVICCYTLHVILNQHVYIIHIYLPVTVTHHLFLSVGYIATFTVVCGPYNAVLRTFDLLLWTKPNGSF